MNKLSGLTVLTTTYNRVQLLKRLYQNLRKESEAWSVQWLIADDGSNDGTVEYLEKIRGANNANLSIEYLTLMNGGKHRALNRLQDKIQYKVVTIIDDDDVLTEGALAELRSKWESWYGQTDEITYLRGNSTTKLPVVKFPRDFYFGNVFGYRYLNELKGDYFESYTTDVFKKTYFPEFENETFLDEGVKWQIISENARGLFINQVIYLSEYRLDGLTQKIRRIQFENSNGFAFFQLTKLKNKQFKFRKRIKALLLFNVFKVVKNDYKYDLESLSWGWKMLNVIFNVLGRPISLFLQKKYLNTK